MENFVKDVKKNAHALYMRAIRTREKGKREKRKHEKVTSEKGMVSVEWALTVPLFLALVLICVAMVVYTNSLSTTTNAARESARVYSLGLGKEKATQVAQKVAGSRAHVDIAVEGDFVRVTVKKPPIDQLDFLGMDIGSTHIALMEPGT